MANNIGLFFNTSKNTRSFAEVLAQVQEYLASKYSTLITDNRRNSASRSPPTSPSISMITAWVWKAWITRP